MTTAKAIETLQLLRGHLQLDIRGIEEKLGQKNLARPKRSQLEVLLASKREDFEAMGLALLALGGTA